MGFNPSYHGPANPLCLLSDCPMSFSKSRKDKVFVYVLYHTFKFNGSI